jgi:hypothetical protein
MPSSTLFSVKNRATHAIAALPTPSKLVIEESQNRKGHP